MQAWYVFSPIDLRSPLSWFPFATRPSLRSLNSACSVGLLILVGGGGGWECVPIELIKIQGLSCLGGTINHIMTGHSRVLICPGPLRGWTTSVISPSQYIILICHSGTVLAAGFTSTPWSANHVTALMADQFICAGENLFDLRNICIISIRDKGFLVSICTGVINAADPSLYSAANCLFKRPFSMS